MSSYCRYVSLNNGFQMPVIGLGTSQSTKEECQKATRTALDCGYRAFDTAHLYLNEDDIGKVLQEYIKAGKVKREDLFITTKLGFIYNRPGDVKAGFEMSLKKLKLEYVDLYLIHGPFAFKNTGNPDDVFPIVDGQFAQEETDILAVWKEMEKLVDDGKAKSIGVSNFNSEQVSRILKISRIKPVTNQVECHAYLAQTNMQEYLKKENIILTAYGPLGSPGRSDMFRYDANEPVLLNDPVVKEIAAKHNKTTAQILLRNMLQRGIAVIPKSANDSRIKTNIEIFDFALSEADMKAIASLDCQFRMFRLKGFVDGLKENPFTIEF